MLRRLTENPLAGTESVRARRSRRRDLKTASGIAYLRASLPQAAQARNDRAKKVQQ
jgi:hypothetical protein